MRGGGEGDHNEEGGEVTITRGGGEGDYHEGRR